VRWNGGGSGRFGMENDPSRSQNRTLPTRHRTPDPQRWRFRLATDVGEGQKQTGCSHSPVRRRGEVEWGAGSCRFGIMENDPSRSQNRTLPTRPPLPIPSVGDSASPWMWAKARSKRGAVIHLCGDAVRWNGGGIGSFFGIMENDPFRSQNRTLPTRHRTPDPQLWKFFLIC
jgi:hypothetical protein